MTTSDGRARLLPITTALVLLVCVFTGRPSPPLVHAQTARRDDRAGKGAASTDRRTRPAGLGPRAPWLGSKIAGTPDPPSPYTIELAFPHLKFEFPVVLVPAAGTSRLFLGDLKGRIWSFPDDPAC